MDKMFRVNEKEVYFSTPTGERGWIVSRRWTLYPAFWRRSGVQRRNRYVNLERMGLGQFDRDFGVPA